MKGSNGKNTTVKIPREELRHDMIKFLSSNENKFLSYQFKLPVASINQYPRKNRFQFQYRLGRSWVYDTTNTVSWLHSPNSSSEYDSFDMYKSMSSRSAKIMQALSSTRNSFRDNSVGIRKSLNFDSTPSPTGNSSYDENSTSSIHADTPSLILNSNSTDSTDSNVPIASVESIDENQNQTPQQNRRKRVHKLSNRTNVREDTRSRASRVMSLLGKGLNEGVNRDTNHRLSSRVVTTSTPRNLAQEFNQEVDHDRPHTPENVIDVVPESISAIKKSHKKEKSHCHEEQSSTQRMDVSLKNDNLDPRTTKSLEANEIAETSCSTENKSPRKSRNIKRTLIYNDEGSNARSDFDHGIQQKITTENSLLASGLDQVESKMQDSNDCESREESMQVDVSQVDDLMDNDEKDLSKASICDEEVSQLSLQEDSSHVCNVSVTSENGIASPESDSSTSQDTNKVVTPENHVNMLKHVLTESIKKSHKKMKHANRKTLFKAKDFQKIEEKMELAECEMSIEDACDDQDIDSQVADIIHVSSPEIFDRPGTPENANSSRLLLLGFNSVKKSHKKDKRSKKTSSFVECRDSEYSKRSSRYREKDIDGISCTDKYFELKESPMLPKKKKKSTSTFLHSSTPKMPNDFKLLGCKNINEEFKIHTPIRKPPILLTVTSHVSADDMLQDDPALATSKKIDYSRCVTPVRRFKELRENGELTSERRNKFETDSVLKKVDTADKNGRSTPINMSTTELLCNVDSIKKSHKKDKHDNSKKSILRKKRSYVEKNRYFNFVNNEKMLEERLSLTHQADNHRAEKEKNKSYKETAYNDPQPSTSREADNIEYTKNITESKYLNITPPNSLVTKNLMKMLCTTSIKKSHKKERNMNAQTKYIFMSQNPDLSDDGSIFDEEDRNFTEFETI